MINDERDRDDVLPHAPMRTYREILEQRTHLDGRWTKKRDHLPLYEVEPSNDDIARPPPIHPFFNVELRQQWRMDGSSTLKKGGGGGGRSGLFLLSIYGGAEVVYFYCPSTVPNVRSCLGRKGG